MGEKTAHELNQNYKQLTSKTESHLKLLKTIKTIKDTSETNKFGQSLS